MAKYICCDECADSWKRLNKQYPDEPMVVKSGSALLHYNCDSCNVNIPKGSVAYCVSLFKNQKHFSSNYRNWESDYIVIFKKE